MTTSNENLFQVCLDIAVHTLREVDDDVTQFIRDLGQAKQELPAAFDVTSDGWHEAQRRIDDACAARDVDKLCEACSEYRKRATAFLNNWRKKLDMPALAPPRPERPAALAMAQGES